MACRPSLWREAVTPCMANNAISASNKFTWNIFASDRVFLGGKGHNTMDKMIEFANNR